MTFWLALRRWLPLLAALSFALMPAAAPAATAGMHAPAPSAPHGMGMEHGGMEHAAMDHEATDRMASDQAGMDVMPCCPPEKAPDPGCGKGCPLMALCLATVASLVPNPVAVPVPIAVRVPPSWPDAASPGTVRPPPLPEPPRA